MEMNKLFHDILSFWKGSEDCLVKINSQPSFLAVNIKLGTCIFDRS